MVITKAGTSDTAAVNDAIDKGYVVNQYTDSDVSKIDEIYKFAKTDKTSKEQGFMFGEKGGSSSIVTGGAASEIKGEVWAIAMAELEQQGDSAASEAHLHPLNYDKAGNVISYGHQKDHQVILIQIIILDILSHQWH